jgi:hypothetical protein
VYKLERYLVANVLILSFVCKQKFSFFLSFNDFVNIGKGQGWPSSTHVIFFVRMTAKFIAMNDMWQRMMKSADKGGCQVRIFVLFLHENPERFCVVKQNARKTERRQFLF